MIARMLVIVVALVGVGALSMACNDDGGGVLTLEEYFAKVQQLDDEQQAASGQLEDEFDAIGPESGAGELADLYQRRIDIVAEFRDGLVDLDPPDQAREAHDEATSTLNDAIEEFRGIIDQMRESDTVAEAVEGFEETDFDAIERSNEACRELEQLAADNDITVDLDCEDE